MEIVVQVISESHPKDADRGRMKPPRTGKWWQLRFQDADGFTQSDVFEIAIDAEFRSDELARLGIPSRIRRCRFDVFVFDHVSERLIVLDRRMTRLQASRLAFEWTVANGRFGVLIWPSGEALPEKFLVVVEHGRRKSEVAA